MPRISLVFPVFLLLAACHDRHRTPPEPSAHSAAMAAAEVTAPVPSPVPRPVATPDPTPCGVARLARFLNLLPTSTARAEIARVAGNRSIRYINVTENDSIGPDPQRLNVETGADGRIKRFSCG